MGKQSIIAGMPLILGVTATNVGNAYGIHRVLTSYNTPIGAGAVRWVNVGATSGADRYFVFPTSGTLDNLNFLITSGAGTGNYQFDFLINGTTNAWSVSFSGATTAATISSSISVAAGDNFVLRSIPTGTPSPTAALWAFDFTPATTRYSIHGRVSSGTAGGSLVLPRWGDAVAAGGIFAGGAEDHRRAAVIPATGTIRNMYVRNAKQISGTGAVRVSFRKNGTETPLSVELSSATQQVSNLVDSFTVTQGDLIDLQFSPRNGNLSSGTDFPVAVCSFVFEGSLDGEYPVFGVSKGDLFDSFPFHTMIHGVMQDGAISANNSNWNQLITTGTVKSLSFLGQYPLKYSTDYVEFSGYNFVSDFSWKYGSKQISDSMTVKDIVVNLSEAVNPGSSESACIARLSKNQEDTSLVVALDGTASYGTSAGSVVVVAGDHLATKVHLIDSTDVRVPDLSVSYVCTRSDGNQILYTQLSPADGNGLSSTVATTSYVMLLGQADRAPSTSAGTAESVVTAVGTLSNWRVLLSQSPSGTSSWEFTVMKNGTATPMTVTISGTSLAGVDTANTVAFTTGDIAHVRVLPSNGPCAAYFSWSHVWDPDTNGECLYQRQWGSMRVANASTAIGPIVGSSWRTSSTYAVVAPCSGTFSKLFAYRSDTATHPETTIALRVNTTDTALVVTLTGTSTLAFNTADSVSVAKGDLLTYKRTWVTASTSTTNVSIGITFKASNEGDFPVLFWEDGSMSFRSDGTGGEPSMSATLQSATTDTALLLTLSGLSTGGNASADIPISSGSLIRTRFTGSNMVAYTGIQSLSYLFSTLVQTSTSNPNDLTWSDLNQTVWGALSSLCRDSVSTTWVCTDFEEGVAN